MARKLDAVALNENLHLSLKQLPDMLISLPKLLDDCTIFTHKE